MLLSNENHTKLQTNYLFAQVASKVKAFKERYPNAVVEEFYTDSYNDKPLMEISKKTYLVKK